MPRERAEEVSEGLGRGAEAARRPRKGAEEVSEDLSRGRMGVEEKKEKWMLRFQLSHVSLQVRSTCYFFR